VAHIWVPHLRDGFIVAKVGIARKRDRSLPKCRDLGGWPTSAWRVAHIWVPHLRDGLIVAKVGIARKRDRSLPTRNSFTASSHLSRKERGEDGAPGFVHYVSRTRLRPFPNRNPLYPQKRSKEGSPTKKPGDTPIHFTHASRPQAISNDGSRSFRHL